MKKDPSRRAAYLALIIAVSAIFTSTMPAQAENTTQFVWSLMSRPDNQVVCEITVDHEGAPTPSEVEQACGVELATQLQDTPECSSDAAGNVPCTGLFLRPEGSQVAEVPGQAIPASAQLRLELIGCERSTEAWICKGTPLLRFASDDGEASDPIMTFYIVVDGRLADCPTSTCEVPLPPTDEGGIEVAYRFTTVSGVTSLPESARVRVTALAGSGGNGTPAWRVEVLSPRLQDDRMDRCGLAWDSLPPLTDQPGWLASVAQPEDLRTNEAYAFLEERLTTLGLTAGDQDGQANGAQPVILDTSSDSLMTTWQNQFDGSIVDAASSRGLPARLLKSLFAQESQFWPGSFPEAGEVGLGQMSALGADNLLLWSPSFYTEFCPEVLHADTCKLPYSRLPEEQKEMLRSALLARVNSDCAECPGFVDLDRAQQTIPIFAESLVAYCSQTGRMVFNVVRETPGLVSSYEDLWRFTLANYNGGSGCLAQALTKTSRQRQPIDWDHVAANLPGGCQNAAEYVSRIFGASTIENASEAE